MVWNYSSQPLKSLKLVCSHILLANPAMRPIGQSGAVLVRRKNQQKSRIREKKPEVEKENIFRKKAKKNLPSLLGETLDQNKEILAKKPVDNVWIRRFYPEPRFSIEETLRRHQAFAQPAMLDNLDGFVYMELALDYSTKKKTKFLSNIRSSVVMPFPFKYGKTPRILVFTKEEEYIIQAKNLGALHAGPPVETIKQLEKGILNPKDFTHVIATADCSHELAPARAVFRERFPTKLRGSVGVDLAAMWKQFYHGHTYESQNVTEQQGKVQIPLGQLKQPVSELVANFEVLIEDVCKHRPIVLGPFIQSICVLAPPSPEVFLVKVEDYVPGYKSDQVDSDDEADAIEAIGQEA